MFHNYGCEPIDIGDISSDYFYPMPGLGRVRYDRAKVMELRGDMTFKEAEEAPGMEDSTLRTLENRERLSALVDTLARLACVYVVPVGQISPALRGVPSSAFDRQVADGR